MSLRILIFGNSGSGKSTLARRLAADHQVPHLDLDLLAWDPGPVRREFLQSEAEIRRFMNHNPDWIIEGCYGDLIEVAISACKELRFLNPGVETCLANCRARPWEPEKFVTRDEQDRGLPFLLQWVTEYETRTDEFSLYYHRRIFDGFGGAKVEVTTQEGIS